MHPKFILAAMTVATIALVSPPADARKLNSRATAAPPVSGTYQPTNDGHMVFVPGGRLGQKAPGGPSRAASRAASRAGKAVSTARRSGRAPKTRQRASYGQTAAGIVRSGKTGATARVAPSAAPRFQAYVDDLEASGASVRFMGGYRKGRCWPGGLHPCGLALDVCQTRRGVVDRRCHLPGRGALIKIAARHGLTEGGIWCNSDMGHAQVGMTAGPCGTNLYSAVRKFKRGRIARRGAGRPM